MRIVPADDRYRALEDLPAGLAVEMYRQMVRIREFDTLVPMLSRWAGSGGRPIPRSGKRRSPSERVRRCAPADHITSTHRGHGHAIAKGVAVEPMMAELFGRESGSCRGKGGSMHIADFSVGMLGANGIVGGGFGIATGAALGLYMSGSDNVVLCFFGDSAINQGALQENANYAASTDSP